MKKQVQMRVRRCWCWHQHVLHHYGFNTRLTIKDGAEVNCSLQKAQCTVADEHGVMCGHPHLADSSIIIRDASDVVHGVKRGEGSLRKSGRKNQHSRFMLKSMGTSSAASNAGSHDSDDDSVDGLRVVARAWWTVNKEGRRRKRIRFTAASIPRTTGAL